ncbi:hypothetical protein SacN8_02435 [Sulfolobus acidocaldarius N8]|uniref:Uncharacterized protein n=1 Tax=Sulfolobus acidocaldarius N8 TaxID=1028566 RepID=M1INL0_9CREN|nr:hypothetical protein SacN8_02435 [Sulfolobus acidocaldarius N8]
MKTKDEKEKTITKLADEYNWPKFTYCNEKCQNDY